MRKHVLAATLIAGMFAVLAPGPTCASVSVSIGISYFHETLAPYGRWVAAEPYGEVWVPARIASGWDPYSDGEWVWTDYGWTWVSFDAWADVTYHYGTWVWVDPYGWVWEPGTVWAPAWVTWAWTDDYIGWAPVPSTFVISTSGYSGAPVVVAPTRYVFVPASQFVGVNASTVRVPETENSVILSRAQKGTHFTVSNGVVRASADPPRSFVERVSKKRIDQMGIGRLRARPTTLATAHVSGKRIAVVAPARERAVAIARAKASTRESKAGQATKGRETHVAGLRPRARSRRTSMASEARGKRRVASREARAAVHGKSGRAAVRGVARNVRPGTTTSRIRRSETRSRKVGSRAVHGAAARREAIHRVAPHRDSARSASARGIEHRTKHVPRASASPVTAYRHESRHERAGRASAWQRPAAAVRPPAPSHASVPVPAAQGDPHGSPSSQAARPHTQRQPQSAPPPGRGKEKKAG